MMTVCSWALGCKKLTTSPLRIKLVRLNCYMKCRCFVCDCFFLITISIYFLGNSRYSVCSVGVNNIVTLFLNSCSLTARLAAELWNTIPLQSTCASLLARPFQGLSLWVCQLSMLQWRCLVWFSLMSHLSTGEQFSFLPRKRFLTLFV